MADFCYQCSQPLFTEKYWGEDFKGLTTKEDWEKGQAAVVLCEGCGPIQVDPEGRCITYESHLLENTGEKGIANR